MKILRPSEQQESEVKEILQQWGLNAQAIEWVHKKVAEQELAAIVLQSTCSIQPPVADRGGVYENWPAIGNAWIGITFDHYHDKYDGNGSVIYVYLQAQ